MKEYFDKFDSRYPKKDFADMYKKNQYIDEKIHNVIKNPYDESEGHRRPIHHKLLRWKLATGVGFGALSTKIFFSYLGLLVQGRKQFIPGFFPFMNSYFNYFGGLKYAAAGFLLGNLFSTFAFGHPYLLEDAIRGVYRRHKGIPFLKRPGHLQ